MCRVCTDREGQAALEVTREAVRKQRELKDKAEKKKKELRWSRATSRRYEEKKKKERKAAREALTEEDIKTKKAETVRKANATKELTKQEKAQRELARRELARRNLLAFILRYQNDYKVGWVHRVICEELMRFSQEVAEQKSPRLMLFMPPRHGKSLIASQYFPAWHLGNNPSHEFICTSYAQSLQMDFSRKIQELIRSKDYGLLFNGLRIAKNNEAVERWGLSDSNNDRTGGGLLAAGVGGPITGRGANVLLIDDPVKNRDEADSQLIREQAKSWYSSTAYTRLMPGAGVLIIQTRWHDDDLSGWQLHEMQEAEKEYRASGVWPEDADRWRVIDFPAMATRDEKYRKAGDALHPERYDLKALRKIKRTLSPRDWAALYQQNPQVEEGAYFEKKMIRYYKSNPPRYMDIYCAGDLAISKSEQADFSVFLVAGVDEHENIYMLDEYRGRGWDADKIIDVMFDIHRRWKPRRFGLEKGHISQAIDGPLKRRIKDAKLYDLVLEELKPGKKDKELRARAIQGLMKYGKVFWPEGALWVPDCINELLRFPSGVKDDRVDAAAWIGQMLATQSYTGSKRPKDVAKSWKAKLKGYVSGTKEKNTAMAA